MTRPVRPLAVLALALPLGVASCGTESASDGEPPLLRLSSTAAVDAALGAPEANGSSYGSNGWRLDGTLPSGTPDDAPVYDLDGGNVDEAQVEDLADALHAGPVRRTGSGWLADRGGSTLIVTASDGRWSYGGYACAVDSINECAVASDVTTVSPTFVAEPPVRPHRIPADLCDADNKCDRPIPVPTPPPLPTRADTHAAADPVIAALGLDADAATYGTGFVIVDDAVDGIATSGFTTTLSVNDNRVSGGSGWLGQPRRGPAYPVIAAKQAYDALDAQPVPLPALECPVQTRPNADGTLEGKAMCGRVRPQVITGATLGLLMTSRADGRAVLVPAWLFDVRGSDEPLAQIAVAPKFLGGPDDVAPPNPGVVEPGDPGGTEPGGGAPGSVGSAEPDPAAPPVAEPSTLVPSSYRLEDGGRTLVLQVADGICVPARYDAAAKEGDATVVVTVTKVTTATPDPDAACPEIARIFDVPVSLDAPLGDRTVETNDGTEVPRSDG